MLLWRRKVIFFLIDEFWIFQTFPIKSGRNLYAFQIFAPRFKPKEEFSDIYGIIKDVIDVFRVFLGIPVHTSNPRRHHHGWPEKFLKFVPPDILRKHFLALSVTRFFYKAFSKLLELSLRKTLFCGWFLKRFIYSNNKITVSLWELRSDLSLQYAANSTKWITRSKVNTHVIYYVVKLITLSLTVSSFASTSLFICFSLVWIFVFSVISK